MTDPKDEKELDLQQWQIDLLVELIEWLQTPEGRTIDEEKIHKKIEELFVKYDPKSNKGN